MYYHEERHESKLSGRVMQPSGVEQLCSPTASSPLIEEYNLRNRKRN